MATFAPEGGSSVHTDLDDCQEEVDDLKAALESRPAIDQAKGILVARHGCTPDEAFEMLAAASQRDNRKVRDLAADIVSSEQVGSAQPPRAT